MHKVLDDQKKFMVACGQTVDEYNPNQFNLYKELATSSITILRSKCLNL
jgi:hypothetical protein